MLGSVEDVRHRVVDGREVPAPETRLPSRGDADAEEQYDHVVRQLNTTSRLYQERTRVMMAYGSHEGNSGIRFAVCEGLRKTGSAILLLSSRFHSK